MAAFVLLLSVACGAISDESTGFIVTIEEKDNYVNALSLSETRTFDLSVKSLKYPIVGGVSNISKNSLPDDLDGDDGGDHCGKNYLAYTFFLKNVGDSALPCGYKIYLSDVTNNIDSALRVRVFINDDGEYSNSIDYAKAAADGQPEPETKPFLTETIVTAGEIADCQPGAIKRFTLVMWLEGDDPECTDDIIGGKVNIRMSFSALQA